MKGISEAWVGVLGSKAPDRRNYHASRDKKYTECRVS
jgi:hypothetical protein